MVKSFTADQHHDMHCTELHVNTLKRACTLAHRLGGILTVEGCFGEEGQESDSGELCFAFTHSYKSKKQRNSV